MRINRVEAAKRYAAVLSFFKANPQATGDAANKALASGVLTGEQAPCRKLNPKQVYALRTQARAELAAAAPAVEAVPVTQS